MPLDKQYWLDELDSIPEISRGLPPDQVKEVIERLWNTAYSEGLSTGRLSGDMLVAELRLNREPDMKLSYAMGFTDGKNAIQALEDIDKEVEVREE